MCGPLWRGLGDARYVGNDPDLRTPRFCEIHPHDDFPCSSNREPKAPDSNIAAEDLDLGEISSAPLFWITGTGLSEEPSRSTTLGALEARSGGITVVDLDYRPMLWNSREETERRYREALKHATVAVGNQEEVEVAVGTGDPHEASAALLDLGLELAIVKRGRGVLARTAEGLAEAPPIEVDVVNGLGAGDAYGGAVHALLIGWDSDRTIRFANAAGQSCFSPACATTCRLRKRSRSFWRDRRCLRRSSRRGGSETRDGGELMGTVRLTTDRRW